ncbi:hypothetical protein H8J86_07795 [Clostridium perfringens]|uniref:hypothetical protein n=1 Tax=Clostridium perfringens TaxID=1502 RepID=UPI0018E437B6|nr:hypothetical protein [Clostridium perfringens]MBI6005853.1 hypothetical protein [Clostridium perfringens]
MTKLEFVLKAERINKDGQKEFFVQSKSNGEIYNWISTGRLEILKTNPNVELTVNMITDPKLLQIINAAEPKKQDLKNPENLYQFIKNTFFDAVNKLRSDNSYKAFRKFVNTYLQEININYIRIEHLSINGFKKIFTECKTLKEFKRVMDLIGREYGSKCVVDTYSNMLDDLKVFEEDGDLEEVEEIKQQLQTCIKLTDNLILY